MSGERTIGSKNDQMWSHILHALHQATYKASYYLIHDSTIMNNNPSKDTSSLKLPKCPLCYAQIEPKELRSCQLVPVRIPKEGEMIELHLVTRQRHSTILQDEAVRGKDKSAKPYLYIPGTVPVSRAVLTYDISPIVEAERKQVNEALWLANSCQELYLVPFLEEGLAELSQRQEIFQKLFAEFKQG